VAAFGRIARPQSRTQQTPGLHRPRLCRFSRLAARFSSNDLAGFFLFSFLRSMPLLIGSPSRGTGIEFYPSATVGLLPKLRQSRQALTQAHRSASAARPFTSAEADGTSVGAGFLAHLSLTSSQRMLTVGQVFRVAL